MIVDLKELERVKRYLKEINDVPFEDIIWQKDGEVLAIEPSLQDTWRFIGLSNTSFPECNGWMPDDIGIRVTTLVGHRKEENEHD